MTKIINNKMLTFKACMKKDNLKIEVTDGVSNMVGNVHSLLALRNDNPELTFFRCVFHSLHLVTNKAAELLPPVINFIFRETHTRFYNISKRSRDYQEIYEYKNSRK